MQGSTWSRAAHTQVCSLEGGVGVLPKKILEFQVL